MSTRDRKNGLKYQNFFIIKEINILLKTDLSHLRQNNKNFILKNFNSLHLFHLFIKGNIKINLRYTKYFENCNKNK